MTATAKRRLPRNASAARRSIYARDLHHDELADLPAFLSEGLEDEISMLRVVMRRVMALGRNDLSIEDTVDLLSALGLAATRLSRLLKTQKELGAENEQGSAITQALSEVLAELGLRSDE